LPSELLPWLCGFSRLVDNAAALHVLCATLFFPWHFDAPTHNATAEGCYISFFFGPGLTSPSTFSRRSFAVLLPSTTADRCLVFLASVESVREHPRTFMTQSLLPIPPPSTPSLGAPASLHGFGASWWDLFFFLCHC